MRPPTKVRRAGFTLIELVVAISLLGIVIGNVYMIMSDGSKAMNKQTVVVDIDSHARRALDRVALAVLGASSDSLWTTKEAPLSSSELNLISNLGMREGLPVWSDPQRISMVEAQTNQVTWSENPNQPSERKVVWARGISSVAENEIGGNGIDDNDNGLIDEKGLSFDIDGASVKITLTIETQDQDGRRVTRSLSTLVTCRN